MAVADDLRRRIGAGEFPPPAWRLPTVTQLAATYGVSRATIDRALRELAGEGLITIKRGGRGGIFIRQRQLVHRNLAENLELEYRRALAGDTSQGVFEAMTGVDAEVTVTSAYADVTADRRTADKLGLPPGTPLLERTFRHVLDGAPFQIARSYMPVGLAARAGLTGPEVEQPGTGTILQLLAAGVRVQDARFTLEARMPTAEEAAELSMAPGTPVVEVWRVLKADAFPVEASKGVIHSDRVGYFLDVDLKEITL